MSTVLTKPPVGQAIEQALTFRQPFEHPPLAKLHRRIEQAEAELQANRARQTDLETTIQRTNWDSPEKEWLFAEFGRLRLQGQTLYHQLKKLRIDILAAEDGWSLFDVEPFRWRKVGLPLLGIFDPDLGESRMMYPGVDRMNHIGWTRVWTNQRTLPDCILNQYSDVDKLLVRRYAGRWRPAGSQIELRARLTGRMPHNIKHVIWQAERVLDHVFLLAEVKNWEVETRIS